MTTKLLVELQIFGNTASEKQSHQGKSWTWGGLLERQACGFMWLSETGFTSAK